MESPHFSSENMHAAAYCWLRLPGNSIAISSVKSESWLIRLCWKSILVGSGMLHFHPGLFVQDTAFAAGPLCRGLVKEEDHLFMFFGSHQESGDHGPDAHVMVDWLERAAAPTGFLMRFDGGDWEGGSLVNWEPYGSADPRHSCRRAASQDPQIRRSSPLRQILMTPDGICRPVTHCIVTATHDLTGTLDLSAPGRANGNSCASPR